jgi:hypothetical protein
MWHAEKWKDFTLTQVWKVCTMFMEMPKLRWNKQKPWEPGKSCQGVWLYPNGIVKSEKDFNQESDIKICSMLIKVIRAALNASWTNYFININSFNLYHNPKIWTVLLFLTSR